VVQVVPFVDFAHAWDNGIGLPSKTLASMGLGLRISPWRWLEGEIYWGGRLTDGLDRSGDLQDHGISFRITVIPFDALD
jgi:hemolysin activation/secretion protein